MGVVRGLFSLVLWAVGLALVAGAVLKLFFVDVIVLGHDAMAPTVAIGEQAFLWRGAEPELGDIVVCQHPRIPTDLVVGRVLGRPGHVVATDAAGNLLVSGVPVETNVLDTMTYSVTTSGRTAPVKRVVEGAAGKRYETFYPEDLDLEVERTEVEPGRLYIVADNRAYRGYDSRTFGTVDAAACRGSLFMLFRPTQETVTAFGHGWFRMME